MSQSRPKPLAPREIAVLRQIPLIRSYRIIPINVSTSSTSESLELQFFKQYAAAEFYMNSLTNRTSTTRLCADGIVLLTPTARTPDDINPTPYFSILDIIADIKIKLPPSTSNLGQEDETPPNSAPASPLPRSASASFLMFHHPHPAQSPLLDPLLNHSESESDLDDRSESPANDNDCKQPFCCTIM